MIKRVIDVVGALLGVVLTFPFVALAALLIYVGDRRSPFFIADRVGLDGRVFRMVKLRTMRTVPGAEWESTKADDPRITKVGNFVRASKLDEFPQLWNVLRGDMSLVGPRPNTPKEVSFYSREERRLLDVRPGVTDLSSIVFADLAQVIKGHPDPDVAYKELVRPTKSALGVFYVDHRTVWLDIFLVFATLLALARRDLAVRSVGWVLERLHAPAGLIERVRGRAAVRPSHSM